MPAPARTEPKRDTAQVSALSGMPESPGHIVGVANSGSPRNKTRPAPPAQSSPHAGTPQSPSPDCLRPCTQAPGCTRRSDHRVASKFPLPGPRAPVPSSAAQATRSPNSSSQPQTPDRSPAPAQNISAHPPPSPDSGTPLPNYSTEARPLPESSSGSQSSRSV